MGLLTRLQAPWATPMLREGEVAPSFQLTGSDGGSHPREGRWWLLFFFGRADRAVRDYLAALAAAPFPDDCDVYGIGPGTSDTLTILSDGDRRVARSFGATLPLGVQPTVFLVNPQRKVRLANRGFPSPAAIIRSIEALKHATRAGV